MNGNKINFDDKKSKKLQFQKNKKVFQIDNIDANKIIVSKKEPYIKNNSLIVHFNGYNDNYVIRPLCLRLPQITGYAKKFNKNATMFFRVNNKQLLKNYNKIWEKTEKFVRIDFESKLVYGNDDKYIKTKIKIYAGSMIASFHNKKMPKEKSPCICLSMIMLDSIIKANKKYYPQTLLEECKYVQEKIKTENYTDEELESDSDCNDETKSNIDNDKHDE